MANATKERFLSGGAQLVKTFKSSPMLNLGGRKGKPGDYAAGVFKGLRENGKTGQERRAFATIILDDTNVTASIKEGTGYKDVKAVSGKEVSIYASSRLERALQNVPEGAEVFVEYQGQDGEAKGNPHIFEVLVKKGPIAVDPEANSDEEGF